MDKFACENLCVQLGMKMQSTFEESNEFEMQVAMDTFGKYTYRILWYAR